MSATTPVADVSTKTVTHEGKTFHIEPHTTEDTFIVILEGVELGRIVYSFGAANASANKDSSVSEDTLTEVAEAWFAALPPTEE